MLILLTNNGVVEIKKSKRSRKVNKFLYSLMNPFPEVPVCNHIEEFEENNVKDINLEIKPNLLSSKKSSPEGEKEKEIVFV